MVEQMGGDVTKKYDSVYSIDVEIVRLMEEGGGGGGGTSSKIVRISKDWYNNQDSYQTEIKKALDDIYNEVSNNRTVTVVFDGFNSQSPNWVIETTNVIAVNKDEVIAFGFGADAHLMILKLRYDEGSNHSWIELDDRKFAVKNQLYLPAVYSDGMIDIDTNEGRVSEFINDVTVENEDFVVIKTTVPAYSGTGHPNEQIYKAIRNNGGYHYYLSKFAGMKLCQRGDDANFDLIPDGNWYVLFNDIGAATYRRIIVTKAVRNEDKSLDVYLGFYGIDLDSIGFYDCTVENRDMQGDEPGKWNERNWVKVSDTQNISVDSFIAIRTRYFCVNTEGVKVDRLVLFKRMK